MIDGLKFDVESDEMRAHLTGRMAYHNERTLFYQDKADSLDKGGAEAMQYSGGDPVRALRDKQSEHEHKTQFFKFIRDHLVKGEVYRLSDSDLVQLEFINKRVRY